MTKPEKVVRRSVALALGTVCIILIAGVAGALAYITPIINSKNNLIASLNSQISSKDSEISQLNSTITNLQNQVNNLTSTLARALSATYKTDNYESWPTGSDGNNWTYVNSGDSTITKSSREAHNGSYSIYVNVTPSSYAYTSCYFSISTTGNFHVRVYFWIDSNVSMNIMPIFGAFSADGTEVMRLEVIESSGIYYLGYFDGVADTDTKLVAVSAGNWQQVDSYYLYSSGQQDIYLNGTYEGTVEASASYETASYCIQGDWNSYPSTWYGALYIDDLTVDNSRPILPPTYVLRYPSYNTTAYGQPCMFSCEWDNQSYPISMVFYSTNVTGTWVYNQSVTNLVAISKTRFWANFTATLPSTLGTVVEYFWTANDSNNNWIGVPMPNQTLTVTQPYRVTTLGTTTSSSYFVGSNVDAVLFDGCYVFWRALPNGYYDLTAFNLTTDTFSDVYTSQGKGWPSTISGSASPVFESGGFVVGNTYYTGYSWQNSYFGYGVPPYAAFTSTLIYTANLSTFYTLGNVNMDLESMCNYTGGGTYNNCLYFGGYQSYGSGTYAAIDCWYNGSDTNMWNGTVEGSDDCCFLTMYNSTCMIGSDAWPNNIIYTNDGVNFVDEYTGVPATTQYPFGWSWSVDVESGTAYLAESSNANASYLGFPEYGGMATWSGPGTYTPTLWTSSVLYGVAKGLVAGSNNVLNSSFTGSPTIWNFNSSGGMEDVLWSNSTVTGSVMSLIYSSNETWYGLYYDVLSENVTIISVTDAAHAPSGHSSDTFTLPSSTSKTTPENQYDVATLNLALQGTKTVLFPKYGLATLKTLKNPKEPESAKIADIRLHFVVCFSTAWRV